MSDSESSSSSSSSASGSRSSSPEAPEVILARAQKAKGKSVRIAGTEARNEGENPHWKLQPPSNSRLADHSVNCEEFDWDAVQDAEDVEVWLVRAPSNLKVKHLEDIQFTSLPRSTSKSSRVGHLARGASTYDVWSVGEAAVEGEDPTVAAAGEEADGLSCLLPRKSKKGKLYLAPKPISRRLVVTAQKPVPVAQTQEDQALRPEALYQNLPRPSHSEELLKHQFMPYGSLIGSGAPVAVEAAMDVDSGNATPASPTNKLKSKVSDEPTPADTGAVSNKKKKPKVDGENTDKAGKKRKPEAKEDSTPKKVKKAKLNAS